jgi:tryptophan halogenase
LFRESGRVVIYDHEGFSEPSFVSMLLGLGVVPQSDDPFVAAIDRDRLQAHMARVRAGIIDAVSAMPDHTDYLNANASA